MVTFLGYFCQDVNSSQEPPPVRHGETREDRWKKRPKTAFSTFGQLQHEVALN